MTSGTLAGTGGVPLRWLAWRAEPAKGRGLVVHGLGEHAGRYDALARALAARGYSVFAYDQQGHGRSGGRRAWIPRFDVFVEDLARAHAEAERTLPGPGPLFLYGHSMGGLVVIRYLERRPSASAVILSAPWLRTAVRVPRWKELAAVLLRRTFPALVIPSSIDPGQLTSDVERQKEYLADPLVGRGISVGLYDAVLEAQRLCLEGPRLPELPTLLLVPLDDPLVDRACTEAWIRRAAPHADVLELPGTRHEPHTDVGREEVFRRVADWLDARTPGGASG